MTHDHEFEVPFADRDAAGAALTTVLLDHPELVRDAPVVVALPRGGAPVAAPIAQALGAPLDVIIVRKLGVPGRPELAMGAIGEGGVRVLEHEVITSCQVSAAQLAAVEAREELELARRAQLLRADRTFVPLAGRRVLLVDDGIATGSTARAAIRVARAAGASSVVLAAPVAPPTTVTELAQIADAVVCAVTPSPFAAIGQWYRDFSPTTDAEVVRILHDQEDFTR
ncbi:MAG TPA: phosphoribosyltransferase family protein [Acidimicrobiia bacterium]|nr:phosphoribosyltransferase family protein [Acidimicrobiia bacterium]